MESCFLAARTWVSVRSDLVGGVPKPRVFVSMWRCSSWSASWISALGGDVAVASWMSALGVVGVDGGVCGEKAHWLPQIGSPGSSGRSRRLFPAQ